MAKKLFGIAIDERIYDQLKRTSAATRRSRNWLIEDALAQRFGVIIDGSEDEKGFQVTTEPAKEDN